MIDVRPAGAGDADELMVLRGVMLGAMRGGPAPTGPWQRTGADFLRSALGRPAEGGGSVAAFVVDRSDGPGLGRAR